VGCPNIPRQEEAPGDGREAEEWGDHLQPGLPRGLRKLFRMRLKKYEHGGRHGNWPPEGAEDAFPTSVATRQDSLDAYYAAEHLNTVLNMWEYTTSANTDPGTLYKMAQHLRRARGNYSDAEKKEYEDALVNFDAAYKASGRIPTIDDYYGIFNNTTEGDVTRVREMTTGVINPRLGLGYYDTGIQPQGLITGESDIAPVVDPMVHREIMPSWEKETTDQYDIIEFPYYDPLAVKPYDLLTEEEKKQRREKYGPEPWEEKKKEKFKVVKRDPPPKPEPEPEPDPAPKPAPTPERKVRVVKAPTGRQPEYLFKAANTGARGSTRTGQVPYAIKEWDDKRKQWRVRDLGEEEIQKYRDKYEIES